MAARVLLTNTSKRTNDKGKSILRLGVNQSQKTPLNEVFDQKVKWALEHFDIPGLAIAVVRDDVFGLHALVEEVEWLRGYYSRIPRKERTTRERAS
jgi:hypothetical protein